MVEVDVVVFGAGIAGASVAWRLAAQRSVVVVEREAQPGYHSTGRSVAMFMESYGPPAARALTRASRAFYEHPPSGFAEQRLLTPRGALYLANHGQETLLVKLRDELAATGTGLEWLSADAAMERVSCLRPELLHAALYESDAHDIDVNALHQGFLRGLRRQGGELRCGATLVSARHDGARWNLQFADGTTLRARSIVNAAGAWADELALQFGAAPVGLVPKRRSAFTFNAPMGVDVSGWPAVAGVDESWYFRPDAGQLIGSPANADPVPPHDVRPEEIDIAVGIHRIQSATTIEIQRPGNTWAGLRSFVSDGELVIGFDTLCPGFFWLAAQGGYGIQNAAGASELAAALLLDQPVPPQLLAHGVDAGAVSPARLR